MIEILLFVCAASLVVLDAATIVVAALALRAVRRYVDLAEERMERLRNGQFRLLGVPTDEQREVSDELERERRAHRDAERKIERLRRELAELRETRRESALPAAVGTAKDRRESYDPAGLETSPNRNVREDGRVAPAGFLETSTRKPADGPPLKDAKPRLGVRYPHPDDAVAGSTPSQPARGRNASVDVFRKHYDKYLENYRGYVELAEHLRRTREEGGMEPGSFEERHWEERLRRVNDGIERTITRLDILEGQNPGLAADDRVSHRARIARRHSELG
ncbi:hypothetical protein GBA65_08360 [Rubrobacter marinus]|uniref:Uncharacterized protein n=1 Tax=Rubrobacter marinus TaxID=2653852 RepID=A0A6G8PWE9_9ACTN|nr:hypothetical protein [Rubrobacter marinus]QIN78532.1 hypothetical protein GBA65_08360 [Rubrobacter marinus]